MSKIRMAQYSTKHGHATSWIVSMLKNPNVELAGVYEPDPVRRQEVMEHDSVFRQVHHWYDSAEEMLNDHSIVAISSARRSLRTASVFHR